MSAANALGGWAALRSWGNSWFDGLTGSGRLRDVLIHCLPGSQLRPRPGIRPTESLVHPSEIAMRGAYQITTMARAAFDEMCGARSLADAVVVADMVTSTTSQTAHTTLDALNLVIGNHWKVRGIVQARRAIALASTRSASPLETRTRLVAALDARLTKLSVNTPVFSPDGRLLGIADLLDEETGLVIESDGRSAHSDETRTHDYDRHELFERGGLTVCRVTADHHKDRWALAARMRATQADASRREKRLWTTQRPAWWPRWQHAARWD